MTKRLLPTIIAVAALASTAYTLTLIDQVIQGTLYSYGLQFNYNWANPYWTLLRVTWALLAIGAAVTTVNTIIIIRSGSKEKRQRVKIAPDQEVVESISLTTQTRERTESVSLAPGLPSSQKASSQKFTPKPAPKPAPTIAPATAPSYTSPEATPLFKCTHCGKTFAQPLRMLDFQVEPPRMVNVCPFCSETIPSAPRTQDSEQTKKSSFFRKNNGQGQKPLTQ